MSSNLPTITLVGRTNVGKSTLFNRLIESQKALVSAEAGTTRDRKEGVCIWRGKAIRIVDTGGMDVDHSDEIENNIVKQAELAMAQSDIILFIVDAKTGPLPQDRELAEQFRDTKKPIIVVGNKAEKVSERNELQNKEWRLAGLSAPIAASAAKGMGIGDLLDEVYDILNELKKPPAPLSKVEATRVAVIGKPNVGKSTLLNAILGEERFIATPIAHTTREPNDVLLEVDGRSYLFVDTAGMRKKGKVKKTGGLEKAGVMRNESVLRHSDVALFVIDMTEPIGVQERTLAGLLKESRVGIIVVANKWDLVEGKGTQTLNEYTRYIHGMIPFLTWAPKLFTSALTKQRVPKLFELIDRVQSNRHTVIDPKELDDFWRQAVSKHKPSKGKGPLGPKVLGMKQIETAPPTFELILKAKQTDVLHHSYLRYLENRLREEFGLEGTPIRIRVKAAQAVSK